MKRETEDEFRARMHELQEFMDELKHKAPEDLVGDAWEAQHYCLKLCDALNTDDSALCLNLIAKILSCEPTEPGLRMIAAVAFQKLENESESLAQIGIALALDPGFYPAHIHMARILRKRSERQAAEAVLATGWEHCKKRHRRRDHERERASYFRVLDEGIPKS